MASSAALQARETAAKLDLRPARKMLDIGGGPGIYAIECARRNPHLRVTVFDRPETLQVARENIARARLKSRVRTRAGDAFAGSLGRGYDLILLSNIVHVYGPDANRELVRRAARALVPGGRLCIKDFLLRPDRTGPERVSLFAVNMLVNTAGGDCYTLPEIKGWLLNAGLEFERATRLDRPSWLVIGRRHQ
jgi:SAM-dependent methyltransferase